MLNMVHDIRIGKYRLGLIDKVSVHRSVELLADTATITLPGAEYNKALDVEQKIHRGDKVSICFGYMEYEVPLEFEGYVQSISVNEGSITVKCEDELFKFRTPLPNAEYKNISLKRLLENVLRGVSKNRAAENGQDAAATEEYKLDCSYVWLYEKFVVSNMTGSDVLDKVQETLGADIYLNEGTLHVHPPEKLTGPTVKYDFARNIEKDNLVYHRANEKKVQVIVKCMPADGKARQVETGSPGGEKVEIVCPPGSEKYMKQRAEAELKRHSYDGYSGTIDTWLVPHIKPGCRAELNDADYPEKKGTYFVKSVTSEFSKDGGKRIVELGVKLS